MTKKICIVGMGPAGLMAGTVLLQRGFEVHFFDHKKAAGRKFLVAGHGGFNLTHSEEKNAFIQKYNQPIIQNAFESFDNTDWINWLEKEIDIKTFVGSSGKIFPLKGIKPIEVLTNWMTKIINLGGQFHYSHELTNFTSTTVTFSKNNQLIHTSFDFLILAIGGASWSKTGSTGTWLSLIESKGVQCKPFEASNSGFEMADWTKTAELLEGQTLKNIEIHFDNLTRKGDIVIADYGLEGAPVYFVNKAFRENRAGALEIDLKPTKTKEEIIKILHASKNSTEGLKQLNLSKTAIQLLKLHTKKDEFSTPEILAGIIKGLKFKPASLRPVDEVISTVGGISTAAVTDNFQLKNFKTIFVCGEMLDWDAPTGGYLIQGCVSSGYVAGTAISREI